MLYHEYELVRRETGERLPPVDRAAYLDHLGEALQWVEEPGLRSQFRRVLQAHGWNGRDAPAVPPPYSLRDRVRQLARTFLADRFGIRPPSVSGFRFPDETQALQYALKYPHPPRAEHGDVAILEPEVVAR
jgi:hypothetical protein